MSINFLMAKVEQYNTWCNSEISSDEREVTDILLQGMLHDLATAEKQHKDSYALDQTEHKPLTI